jgi:hypothetical protein
LCIAKYDPRSRNAIEHKRAASTRWPIRRLYTTMQVKTGRAMAMKTFRIYRRPNNFSLNKEASASRVKSSPWRSNLCQSALFLESRDKKAKNLLFVNQTINIPPKLEILFLP